ncbi:MAG: hypothetical protein M1833_006385 [Piccolia ochrophora]|nr:MAG: hypothetical protein M1833_006385 [Piccolia ochrophora]
MAASTEQPLLQRPNSPTRPHQLSRQANPDMADAERSWNRGARSDGSSAVQGGNQRGGRRGRGPRGRGSSVRGGGNPRNTTSPPVPPVPPPPDDGGTGKSGVSPAEDPHSMPDDVEADICFICASSVEHNAVSPCNHRTCHICALRLRALYKTKACAHCRTNADFVTFTDDASKRYEDFKDQDFSRIDESLGIKYERPEIFDDTVLLLRYNCPDSSCDVACRGWPDLHRHVKAVHHKVMCDLCTRNKKVFTHEHELFTYGDLRKHEKFGDDDPGAVDQSGFRGHPECGFCRQRFYGDDELYIHCRDKHEKCHICARRNQAGQQQYYQDYNALEVHFRDDHFLCLDRECLDKKFVVFESEMDLKAHQLEAHPNELSKDARKEARRVDISNFDYRGQYRPEERGGRREARGRGRGRDPNTESIPHSSAQPLRRDEMAYQRQMAIHGAQGASARTFGGQLTGDAQSNPIATVSVPRPSEAARTAPSTHEPPPNAPPVSSIPFSQTPTPQSQARQLHHSAVMARATNMLGSDADKTSEFRTKVSLYQRSQINSQQLIDAFFLLFDASTAELGKLIRELAEIYEEESKRRDLLKAWNDWSAINEDYPSLPGPSGVLPGTSITAGSGGKRVLRLKSATAQSGRSRVSQHSSWGSAAPASSPFPPMQANSSSNNPKRTGTKTPAPAPWAAASSSAPGRPASRAPTSRPSATTAITEAFPALPTAARPTTTIFGYGTGAVRRDGGGRSTPPVNAWGNGGASSSANASAAASETEEPERGGKKKGKAGKKQMLFHFG